VNNSPVADALRFAVTQTVRALTQPGGIQAVAADLQHQTQARPANLAPNTQQTLTAHANAGATRRKPGPPISHRTPSRLSPRTPTRAQAHRLNSVRRR